MVKSTGQSQPKKEFREGNRGRKTRDKASDKQGATSDKRLPTSNKLAKSTIDDPQEHKVPGLQEGVSKVKPKRSAKKGKSELTNDSEENDWPINEGQDYQNINCPCGSKKFDQTMVECSICKLLDHNACIGLPEDVEADYVCAGCKKRTMLEDGSAEGVEVDNEIEPSTSSDKSAPIEAMVKVAPPKKKSRRTKKTKKTKKSKVRSEADQEDGQEEYDGDAEPQAKGKKARNKEIKSQVPEHDERNDNTAGTENSKAPTLRSRYRNPPRNPPNLRGYPYTDPSRKGKRFCICGLNGSSSPHVQSADIQCDGCGIYQHQDCHEFDPDDPFDAHEYFWICPRCMVCDCTWTYSDPDGAEAMIQCNSCSMWQHRTCVGVSRNAKQDYLNGYKCMKCNPRVPVANADGQGDEQYVKLTQSKEIDELLQGLREDAQWHHWY